MGVFIRADSPYYWLWLETTKSRERTAILVGHTTTQRRDSRRLAEDHYHQRMNALAIEKHDLPRPLVPITFGGYCDWYLPHVVAHHRGADREQGIIATLRAAFGSMPLTAVTLTRVLEWRTARIDDVTASTVNRELDVLKTMLARAVPQYLKQSPLVGLKRLRETRFEARVLTREEEMRLLAALSPADRALVICALDTLMRLSDVVRLRRDHDRGSYLIVEDPKVAPYKVPVSTRLRAALDGLRKCGPFYFAHRMKAENPRDYRSGIQSMLERACKAADIPYGRRRRGLTFHGLRHTGATRLVETGVSLRVIQEIGGWKSLRQLERYAHPSDAVKRDAVEAIAGATNAL